MARFIRHGYKQKRKAKEPRRIRKAVERAEDEQDEEVLAVIPRYSYMKSFESGSRHEQNERVK